MTGAERKIKQIPLDVTENRNSTTTIPTLSGAHNGH